MQPENYHAVLNERGTVLIEPGQRRVAEVMSALAASLGTPVPGRRGAGTIECLKPLAPNAAKLNSLSRVHGIGLFPLHTDGAHWEIPPRYILLSSVGQDTRRGTSVIDGRAVLSRMTSDEVGLVRRGVVVTRSGRRSQLVSIVNERGFLRFDRGCMIPASLSGRDSMRIMSNMLDKEIVTRVGWEKSSILIIDNWRCVHGREPAPVGGDDDRSLLRITVADASQEAQWG